MKRSRLSQIIAVLISSVISPLSLLAVVTFVTNGSLFGTAILGGLIMIFFSSGIALQSDLSHLKNDFKLQDMIVSSPTSSRLYLGGMALAEIVYSMPAIAILIILAGVYLHLAILQVIVLSTVLILMFATSVAIGFMLSTFSSDVVQSYAFSRLLTLLFATLPPVYYPITYVPPPLNYIAYLSPTTYAAQIMQATTGYIEISTGMLIFNWAVLIGVTAIILLIALKKTRWKEI
jgi:ABC-2 type transport system permease protein